MEAEVGRRETGAGSRTGFEFSCPDQELLSSRKQLDRQYLQQETEMSASVFPEEFLSFF